MHDIAAARLQPSPERPRGWRRVRREIWRAIGRLKAEGLALLLVDKNLKELLPLADRCVVLEKGRSVWTGGPADLAGDRDLQNRYLGA
jgi:branched-chain amino acid transport system ATP-binding protein